MDAGQIIEKLLEQVFFLAFTDLFITYPCAQHIRRIFLFVLQYNKNRERKLFTTWPPSNYTPAKLVSV